MKPNLFLASLVIMSIITGLVFALPSNRGIDQAEQVSPAIETGDIIAPPEFVAQLPESQLNKVVFIRYAPGFQKERPCNNNNVCEPELGEKGWCGDCKGGEEPAPEPTTCYDFLAGSKPRWNWIEDYYYSDSGLGSSSASAVTTWEAASPRNIFGAGISGTYPWGTYDLVNSISYGDYDDTGKCPTLDPCVIGVTAIWYRGKNIYEYDIMYDTDFFPGSIDLDTVVLHELGHGAGLSDLYDVACSDEVMYWQYLGPKTSLEAGDIAGISELYS